MTDTIKSLFSAYTGHEAGQIEELKSSGSHRRYFRISSGDVSVIGVIGTDRAENNAFLAMAKHFAGAGISVPEVYAVSEDGMCYIQEDLGDVMLFDAVAEGREKGEYSDADRDLLCRTMAELADIQFRGGGDLDYDVCYPNKEFGSRMIMFDLNYFKYCFLKATGLEFNEVRLQDDFERLGEDLLSDFGNTFMYRDFQSRNVMVKDGKPYFIDFQGGVRGPVYYDVASFVWQARARYPEGLRRQMIASYLESLRKYIPDMDAGMFNERLRLFVLFRTMQVLGAYGFRGYFEKKPHFLASVPHAIANLRTLLKKPFPDYPYLSEVLTHLASMHQFNEIAIDRRLEVKIYSFSYKKGIPVDTSGNGGGYVFDCRSVNNPGKYEHYRQFTGLDKEVIDFLEKDGEITVFLQSVFALVDAHVKRFMERKFTNLQVCFGCTGGQHRSVYSAEHLAAHLSSRFDIKVKVIHRELNIERG